VSPGSLYQVQRLIEAAPLTADLDPARLRTVLSLLDDPRVLLPCADGTPWLLVHTRDLDADGLLALLPGDAGISLTELRARIALADPATESLRSLIHAASSRQALAVGRAAVERAAQRRRLDLIVTAADIDPGYADSLERILAGCAPGIQVITAAETSRALGKLTGAKRAGVVGFIRGSTALTMTGQARRYHGCDVSSVPGSPSSAQAPQQPLPKLARNASKAKDATPV
jgi:ribosomal protein L7Ae-like RNA K-turn-binding protein